MTKRAVSSGATEDLRMRPCIQAAPKPALGSKSMPSPDLGSAHERVKIPFRYSPRAFT